jgi:hypothetical protein
MVKRVAAEMTLASLPNQYLIFVEQAELACILPSAAGPFEGRYRPPVNSETRDQPIHVLHPMHFRDISIHESCRRYQCASKYSKSGGQLL